MQYIILVVGEIDTCIYVLVPSVIVIINIATQYIVLCESKIKKLLLETY
jgi:hypothetical protein